MVFASIMLSKGSHVKICMIIVVIKAFYHFVTFYSDITAPDLSSQNMKMYDKWLKHL